jgi:hypothetical protein
MIASFSSTYFIVVRYSCRKSGRRFILAHAAFIAQRVVLLRSSAFDTPNIFPIIPDIVLLPDIVVPVMYIWGLLILISNIDTPAIIHAISIGV